MQHKVLRVHVGISSEIFLSLTPAYLIHSTQFEGAARVVAHQVHQCTLEGGQAGGICLEHDSAALLRAGAVPVVRSTVQG
jgi:hypothetical protein